MRKAAIGLLTCALIPPAVALVALPAPAVLTNDLSVVTSSFPCEGDSPITGRPCGGGTTIKSFGTTSYGAPDAGNGFDFAQTAWFQDHFGLDARGSANSTENPGGGSGAADGSFFESLLVPVQPGLAQGDPGVPELPYHLHGTVTSDWGDNFVNGVHVGGAKASLAWSYSSVSNGVQTVDAFLEAESWSGNHLSVVVDRDMVARVPFHVGQIFYLGETANLLVSGSSPVAPAVGFVEADFLHTATLGPAIVLDKFGNPLSNPVIESDSGFDFAHPQVPEPSSALLLATAVTSLAACRKATRLARSSIGSPGK